MYIYILVVSVFVGLCLFANKYKCFLSVSFWILFLFLAIRYNFGNDYIGYSDHFDRLTYYSFDLLNFDYESEVWEPGWLVLNLLCYSIGFKGLIVIWSFLFCAVFYTIFKKYISPSAYWFAGFILLVNTSGVIIQLSMLRNSMAAFIFLCAFPFLLKKKIIIPILLILLAASIHKTAFMLLPCVLLPFISWEINKKRIIYVISIFVIAILLTPTVISLSFDYVTNSDVFESYSGYYDVKESLVESGIGMMFDLFFFLYLIWNIPRNSSKVQQLAMKFTYAYYLLLPISLYIMMFERFRYYFFPFFIISASFALIQIKNDFFKFSIFGVFILFLLYKLYTFFNSPVWVESYRTYQTIFNIL